MIMDTSDSGLFAGIVYTIVPSEKLDPRSETCLEAVLNQGGAEHVPLFHNNRVDDIRRHTHIVSETVDFPDYYAALDANVQVVKPSWVTTSVDKKRQSQTRQHSPDPAMFLSQVVLSCGDLPEGDKDAIIAGVLAMGGLYSSPLTKLVTHVVTLDPDNKKCLLAMDKMPDCKIVLPHWFDDCFRLGKLINEIPYTFPDPEILRQDNKDPVRMRQTPDIEGATSAVGGKPPTYHPPHSPSQSRKELTVLKGKRILFSRDLNINPHLAKTLESIVEQAGGQMTEFVDDCDIYIGHYREGNDYVEAFQAGKEVANLAWFYNVINRNRWTNPLTKLLHYPVPRDGISGFRGMRISLSNYTGEARIYLENLVKEAGAEFTKTMKQDNTHLITAHKQSEKCEAAQEWNINIINHLWLEESYAKCAVQSLTHSRYTTFPSRTNLSEVVGQTPINLDMVRRFYFATREKTIKDVEEEGLEPADGLAPRPYRGAVKPQRSPRKTVPASSAVPATAPMPTAADDSITHTSVEAMDTLHEEEEAPVPRTARKAKGRGVADAETPLRKTLSEKESETPPTTGRASKNRALDAMHKQKEDIALFQKEMKRKGGVIRGGRRISEDDAPESAKKATRGKKRASVEAVDADGDSEMGNGSAEEEAVKPTGRQTKKAKKSDLVAGDDGLPPVKYKMLVTGDVRWQGKPKKEDEDARKLRKLGVQIVTEPTECNLLCAPTMKRTAKFITALALAPEVVSTSFLDNLLKSSKDPDDMPPTSKHPLVDRDFEEKWGFRLSQSLERAKENQRRLLRGWTVFITDKVTPSPSQWQEFIKVNGGTAALYKGRTGLTFAKSRTPPSKDPDAGPEKFNLGPNADDDVDVVYLVSGTTDEEVKLWKTFRTQVEKQKLRPRIVTTEWVIHFAMAQRVEWDDKWECREETVPGYKEKYGR